MLMGAQFDWDRLMRYEWMNEDVLAEYFRKLESVWHGWDITVGLAGCIGMVWYITARTAAAVCLRSSNPSNSTLSALIPGRPSTTCHQSQYQRSIHPSLLKSRSQNMGLFSLISFLIVWALFLFPFFPINQVSDSDLLLQQSHHTLQNLTRYTLSNLSFLQSYQGQWPPISRSPAHVLDRHGFSLGPREHLWMACQLVCPPNVFEQLCPITDFLFQFHFFR